MVWDKGIYVASVESPLKELEKGKLHFSLSGKKLHGEWYLVQLRGSTQWLLIKGGEDLKPLSKKLDDTSALSITTNTPATCGRSATRLKISRVAILKSRAYRANYNCASPNGTTKLMPASKRY